jgi:hypothetical protein
MKLPLALQLACLSLITTTALSAEEPLAISSMLKIPGDYHLQVEDKTGSIQVLVPGPCGNPGLAAPIIPGFTNGDGVRIEARIEAPGYYTGQGLPPGGNVRDTA